MFWPDAGRAGASSVRQAIHTLRDRLEPDRPKGKPSGYVVARKGGYELAPGPRRDRRRRLRGARPRRARRAAARRRRARRAPSWPRPRRAYGGNFLADEPYAEWALAERERLRDLAAQVLRGLAGLRAGGRRRGRGRRAPAAPRRARAARPARPSATCSRSCCAAAATPRRCAATSSCGGATSARSAPSPASRSRPDVARHDRSLSRRMPASAVLAAVLALASSLSWGLSDFLGGFQSRRARRCSPCWCCRRASRSLILVVAVLAGAPTEHDAASTLWAAGVGGLGLLGLVAFYRALAIGTMSVVAPISATGVVDPGARRARFGRAARRAADRRHRARVRAASCSPSRAAPSADEEARRAGRTAIGLALLAAIGFGSFFAGHRPRGGDRRRRLGAARRAHRRRRCCCSSPAPSSGRGCRARRRRWARSPRSACSTCSPTCCSCSPPGAGLLSVVGVLGSLYPAVTVVLARVVLHERLTRAQSVGVLVTLAGVVALAAG